MRSLGETIKEGRKKLNLTMVDLAQRVGLTQGYLSKIENDVKKPTVEVLKKISEVLNIPNSELMNKAGYLDNRTRLEELYVQRSDLEYRLKISKIALEDFYNGIKYEGEHGEYSKDDLLKIIEFNKQKIISINNEINVLEMSLNTDNDLESLDEIVEDFVRHQIKSLEENGPFELKDFLESDIQFIVNGKTLSKDEKHRLLNFAEIMFTTTNNK